MISCQTRSVILFAAIIGSVACRSPGPDAGLVVSRAVAPEFPAVGIAAGAEGSVKIEAVISPSGEVVRARILDVKGLALIYHRKWYEQLAEQWRFLPTESDGTRTATIEFVFRMMPQGTPPEQLATTFLPPSRVEIKAERPLPVQLFESESK